MARPWCVSSDSFSPFLCWNIEPVALSPCLPQKRQPSGVVQDHMAQDRLTHVHSLLAWKPSPLQSSTRCIALAQLNSRYYNQDLRLWQLSTGFRQSASLSPQCPSTRCSAVRPVSCSFQSPRPAALQRHGMGLKVSLCRLERHPFWERFTSAGELLHTP